VVAAGATGAASLVQEGETGRLVAPGRPEVFAPACAEALAPYCTDDALRLAHGANGERAARAYSWDVINQAVVDTYLRLLEARRAAG
jgi:glycosyltransferase involved in cell wall biosynthesis